MPGAKLLSRLASLIRLTKPDDHGSVADVVQPFDSPSSFMSALTGNRESLAGGGTVGKEAKQPTGITAHDLIQGAKPASFTGEHPGTMKESAFLSAKKIRAEHHSNYFDSEGNPITSSRETPARAVSEELGSWQIDEEWTGLYGRMIDQLQELSLSSLVMPEADYSKPASGWVDSARGDDARRYAEWMKQGHEPPPINVLETDDTGAMKITDGHRRASAAKMAGRKTIRAWVSPSAETGKLDYEGNPIKTALTLELAQKQVGESAVSAHTSSMLSLLTQKSDRPVLDAARNLASLFTGQVSGFASGGLIGKAASQPDISSGGMLNALGAMASGAGKVASKAFDKWFGESKVVDEAGAPKTVYHGTAKGGFGAFDKKFISSENLYGPGFYFTEDKSVARDYSEIGAEDLDHTTLDSAFKFLRDTHSAKEMLGGYWGSQDLTQGTTYRDALYNSQDHLVKTAEKSGWVRPASEIKQAHLSVKNPYDPQKTPDVKEWPDAFKAMKRKEVEAESKFAIEDADVLRRLVAEARKNTPGDFVKGGEWEGADADYLETADRQEFWGKQKLRLLAMGNADDVDDAIGHKYFPSYNEIVRDQGSKEGANEWLQSMGFDAITHVGGSIMGGGHEHRVWIPFEPTQIKSAVGNRGTYDPDDPRMDYAAGGAIPPEPWDYSAREKELMERTDSAIGQFQPQTNEAVVKRKPLHSYFSITAPDGSNVVGVAGNRYMPGESENVKHGELYMIEVAKQRQGMGTSLAKDAIQMMQLAGSDHVIMRSPNEGGEALNAKLIRDEVIGEAVSTHPDSGTTLYPIIGGGQLPQQQGLARGGSPIEAGVGYKSSLKFLQDTIAVDLPAGSVVLNQDQQTRLTTLGLSTEQQGSPQLPQTISAATDQLGTDSSKVPVLVSPGEVVLDDDDQRDLGRSMGRPAAAVFAAIGVPGFLKGPERSRPGFALGGLVRLAIPLARALAPRVAKTAVGRSMMAKAGKSAVGRGIMKVLGSRAPEIAGDMLLAREIHKRDRDKQEAEDEAGQSSDLPQEGMPEGLLDASQRQPSTSMLGRFGDWAASSQKREAEEDRRILTGESKPPGKIMQAVGGWIQSKRQPLEPIKAADAKKPRGLTPSQLVAMAGRQPDEIRQFNQEKRDENAQEADEEQQQAREDQVKQETSVIIEKLKDFRKGLAKTILALIVAPWIIQKFGQSLINSRRELAQYNGTIASAMAVLDVQQVHLGMRQSRATETSTKELVEAQMQLNEAIQPIREDVATIVNHAAKWLVKFGTGMAYIVNVVKKALPWLDAALEELEKGNEAGGGPHAQELAKLLASGLPERQMQPGRREELKDL